MLTVRLALLLFTLSLNLGALLAQSAPDATVHIDTTPSHQINSFDPDYALGSSLDVLSRRDIDRVHTPHIVQESISAGWGPITYRNNSELRMAASHWTTNALDFDGGPKGEWKVFHSGKIENAQGGTQILKLADTPISSRYVRIMMSESSNTCDEHDPRDIRNCVGYAVQQIELGSSDASG